MLVFLGSGGPQRLVRDVRTGLAKDVNSQPPRACGDVVQRLAGSHHDDYSCSLCVYFSENLATSVHIQTF